MTGILLCDDLMWTSRITGVAGSLGISIRAAKTEEALLRGAAETSPALVILDLDACSRPVGELVPELVRSGSPPRVMAFGSHVAVEALNAARAAGCDPVLSRSQMARDLPAILGACRAG